MNFPQVDQPGADKISAVFPADGVVAYNLAKRRLIYFKSNRQFNVSTPSAYGFMSMESNTIATPIATPSTPVPFSGTAIAGSFEGFVFLTGISGNRFQYQLTYQSLFSITCSAVTTLDLAQGLISIVIVKNGVAISTPGGAYIGPVSPAPACLFTQCTTTLNQNDEVSFYIQNESSTDSPTVIHANLIIKEI
jgi:hypothetical protein